MDVLGWIQLFSESFLRFLLQFQEKHRENSEMRFNYTQLIKVLILVLEGRRKEGCMQYGKMILFYISMYFFTKCVKSMIFKAFCFSVLVNVTSVNVLKEVINLILISNFVPRACFTSPLIAIMP